MNDRTDLDELEDYQRGAEKAWRAGFTSAVDVGRFTHRAIFALPALIAELRVARGRVAELETNLAEQTHFHKVNRDGFKAASARVIELEGLIRSRCEHLCTPSRVGYGRHAPECLVEEAGL